jgi:hypothetical protein
MRLSGSLKFLLLFILVDFFLDYFTLCADFVVGLDHVVAEFLCFHEGQVAVFAAVGFVGASAALLVDIPHVCDDVVAVQELLEANAALVVTFPGVRLHVASEFGFGVESEAADLEEMNRRVGRWKTS